MRRKARNAVDTGLLKSTNTSLHSADQVWTA